MSQDLSEGRRQDGDGEGAEKADLGSPFSLNQSIMYFIHLASM